MTTVLTAFVTAIIVTVLVDAWHHYRQRRRAAKAREQVERAMEQMFGLIRAEDVDVRDIKYGDHIIWVSRDQRHHHPYVAGYDGDSGPSREGRHVRPANQGDNK